jgi:L-iditol 2-dehydrogenase
MEAARKLGAEVFAADEAREAKAVAKAAGGLGLDVAIECAGTQLAIDAAVEAVRPGARIVIDGIPSAERTSFRASIARRKGLTVAFARRMKHVYPRAIAMVQAGQADLRSVVSHTLPLVDAGKAFETAASRCGLKVVVTP